MSNHYKSKEFKVLEDLWYLKLKQSGFEDIEQPGDYLKWTGKQDMVRKTNRNRGIHFESIAEYFRLAEHFLHKHEFKDLTTKIIWERHSEGDTMRSIVQFLKENGHSRALTQVKETIHKLRAIMLAEYRKSINE